MRHDRVGHGAVVREEIALRDPVVREEHPVGRRELDPHRFLRPDQVRAVRDRVRSPSGSSAPSSRDDGLAHRRGCAIQLTERRLSRIACAVEHVVVRDECSIVHLGEETAARSRSSHSGSSSQRRSASSWSRCTSCTNSLGLGSRTIVVALVPDDGEDAAGPQHARDLRQRDGLSNQWNACAAKTPSTDASSSGIALGRSRRRDRAAGTTRSSIARMSSSGSTAVTSRKRSAEHARQLAGAGAEIEHGGVALERQLLEQLGRIARSRPLVLVGDAVEAQLAAVSQRRRAGRCGVP